MEPDFSEYHEARCEHAWLLRAEGLGYREIGSRLGVGRQRADDMVRRFGRRVQAGITRQRAKRMIVLHTQQWAIACERNKLQAEADRWIEAWSAP